MKIDEKGNIISATRAEIARDYYASGKWTDMFTLDEYIALLKYRGTVILDDVANQDQD